MPLSITAIARENGPGCDHITVTVNHEGVSRTFNTSFPEIDAFFSDLTPLEQLRLLVVLWAKYRRMQSRAVVNVEFA